MLDAERTGGWMKQAADVCEHAAKGNLEIRLLNAPTEGDLGRLLHSINHLLDVTDAFVREAGASLDHAARGEFHRRFLLRGMPGTFRHGAKIINAATAAMHAQHDKLAEAEAKRLEVADRFDKVVGGVIETVASSATEMRTTAEDVVAMIHRTTTEAASVAASAEEASGSVQTAAAATEELTASFQEVDRRSKESAEIAARSAAEARRSSEGIRNLQVASSRMGGVVRLISQIARQTNLLALNATIEAARSGEAGRGFAVVASEVKNLARQTARATDDIGREIDGVLQATEAAVGSMNTISENVDRLNGISSSIALAIDEQRIATDGINRGVHIAASGTQVVSESIRHVSAAARQTGASATQMMSAADELSRQAETLRAAASDLLARIRS